MPLKLPLLGGRGGADRWVTAFILAYVGFLVFLAFYVENLGNAVRVDPVRLYSTDAMLRFQFVQCLPVNPALLNSAVPLHFYLLLAVPVTQILHWTGVSSITSHRLFTILLSLLTLGATYGILRRLNLGSIFTLLPLVVIASNPLYLVYSVSTLETMGWVAFTMTGIYFFYRKNFLLSAVFVSLSALIRMDGYPITGMWMLYYVFRFRRSSLKYLAAAAAPHLVHLLLFAFDYGNPFYNLQGRAAIFGLYWSHFAPPQVAATPAENLATYVFPIIRLHGYLFFAFASAAFFFTLRKKEFLPLNTVIGASLISLALFLFVFPKELSDRWTLLVVVASAVPMARLLRRLSELGRRATGDPAPGRPLTTTIARWAPHGVAVLAVAMVAMNVANLGAQAPGDCCDIGTFVPRETMAWIKHYMETQSENRVYYYSPDLFRLPLADNDCTLFRKDVRYFVGPGQECSYLVVSPAEVNYTLDFPSEGVLLSKREVKCVPGMTLHPVGEIPSDRVRIYSIERASGPRPA